MGKLSNIYIYIYKINELSKERWNKYLCKCSISKPKGDEGLLINLASLGGVV